MGSLRGLGGIGAVWSASRWPPDRADCPGRVAATAFVLLAIAALPGPPPGFPRWRVLPADGVSNALLYPALSTAAADRFGSGPAAGAPRPW